MLMAGIYRCITEDGMRTAQEAVHSNLRESRTIYDFVIALCIQLGATSSDLVPFDKYAAAESLVQLVAEQQDMSHPDLDAIVALIDLRLDANRKKATA